MVRHPVKLQRTGKALAANEGVCSEMDNSIDEPCPSCSLCSVRLQFLVTIGEESRSLSKRIVLQ